MAIDWRTLLGTTLAAGLLPASVTAKPAADVARGSEGVRLWPGDPPGVASRRRALIPRCAATLGGANFSCAASRRRCSTSFALSGPMASHCWLRPAAAMNFLRRRTRGCTSPRRFARWLYRFCADLPTSRRRLGGPRRRAAAGCATRAAADPRERGGLWHRSAPRRHRRFLGGGHVAANLAVGAGERVYAPVDAADRLPVLPDFAVLLYAVTTLRAPGTHQGSLDHLLGPDPSSALVDRRSPVLHIDARTLPSSLLHALDDTIVPRRPASTGWRRAARRGCPSRRI